MGVKRRGPKNYTISIFLGRDKNGKRIYKYETFHGNLTQARQREAELKASLRSVGPKKSAVYLGDYFDLWLDNIEESVEETTYRIYSYHIKKLKPVVGDLTLYGLTADMLQERMKNKFNNLTHKTQKGIYATLRTVLRKAVASGLISSDPTVGLSIPRGKQQEHNVLNQEELLKLLDVLKEYKHHAILRLLAVTGMRVSEVLALKWKDIDFKKCTVTIKRAADTVKRKLHDKTKTPASTRTIKLDDETIQILKKHQEEQSKYSITPLKKNEGLVFRTPDNRVIRYGAVRSTLMRALKRAGLEHIRIHDLRHTVATILLNNGCSLSLVASLLGHANVGVTATIYTHKNRGGESLLNVIDPDLGYSADKSADKNQKS